MMKAESGKATEKAPAQRDSLLLETRARVEFRDITDQVRRLVDQSGVEDGLCVLFTPHTTAAVLINENDDAALQTDFDQFLRRLAPQSSDYHHNDGNCDAHLKAAVIGNSKTLLIEQRGLVLGRWQGVFFCEFDGPRRRELRVKIVSD